MRTLLLFAVLAGTFLFPATLPSQERITVATLRAACDSAAAAHDSSAVLRRVRDFCALDLPASMDATVLGKWRATTIPSPAEIIFVAQGMPPVLANLQSLSQMLSLMHRHGVHRQLGSNQLLQSAEAANAPVIAAATLGISPAHQGAALVGLTDHAVGRAKDVVDLYIIKAFANYLCRGEFTVTIPATANTKKEQHKLKISEFLPATCELIDNPSSRQLLGDGYGLPTASLLQVALQRDLNGMPDVVLEHYREYGVTAFGPMSPTSVAARERFLAVIGASRVARTYLERREIAPAFHRSLDEVLGAVEEWCAAVDGRLPTGCGPAMWPLMPRTRDIVVAASIIEVYSDADLARIRAGGPTRARDLVDGTKAVIVNAGPNGQEHLNDAWDSFAKSYIAPLGAGMQSSAAYRTMADHVGELFASVQPLLDSVVGVGDRLQADLREAKRDRSRAAAAYAAAAADLVPMLAHFRGQEQSDVAHLVGRIARHAELRAEGRHRELMLDVFTLANAIARDPALAARLGQVTMPPEVLRTLQFALDASIAKDSDGFQRVIEAYASPVDGFMRKRTRGADRGLVYFSINSYVGAAVTGREIAKTSEPTVGDSKAGYYGVALPVGVETGLRLRKWGALGVMLQVADLGQVASWRVNQKDSVVSTTPTSLTLANVYAPGVNMIWNMPRIPLAIGAGYARVPQFRAVEPTNAPATKATVYRTSLFVAVDVPLLP